MVTLDRHRQPPSYGQGRCRPIRDGNRRQGADDTGDVGAGNRTDLAPGKQRKPAPIMIPPMAAEIGVKCVIGTAFHETASAYRVIFSMVAISSSTL
jgi:hypothetical protein